MNKQFLEWINCKKEELDGMGIETENIKFVDKSPNPSTSVDHLSQICLGRITVWESGLMDVEILDFETEKTLLFDHYQLSKTPDFDRILERYFNIIKSGVAE